MRLHDEHPDRELEARDRADEERRIRNEDRERSERHTPPIPRARPTMPRPVTSPMVTLAWNVLYGPHSGREAAAKALAELVLGE